MYFNNPVAVKIKYTLKCVLSVYEAIQISDISVVDKIPVKFILTEIKINQISKNKRNLLFIKDLSDYQQ